jgi:glutamyl-tRNA reductase
VTASLLLIGLSHRTAPVDVRERLSVAEAKLPEVVRSLVELPAIDGACVLSTCNRVEVLVSAANDATDLVIDWMSAYARVQREDLEPHLYIRRGHDAADHLFRVTAGLDSMIIGEPQIAGQVKKAFRAGALDPALQQVWQRTLHVAKRVRSETAIGELAVSVPYAAIELAKKIFGELAGLRVLLLGAGEMGELTAEHLGAQHVKQIFVANKTYERAVELAERFDGTAVQFSSFEEHLGACDIVIASTAAPHFVIEPAQVHRALEARSQRGLFLIDLSVPRNIDPSIERIDGAYLYNIDDLQQVASANLELRQQRARMAEEIIAAEVEALRRHDAEQRAAPTIRELRARLDAIRSMELEKCLRRLGPITIDQREAIEQLSQQMMNKILHQPIVQLKEDVSVRQTVRTIFGLA